MNGIKLNNPLPDMIRDEGQLAECFQKYPLIPWLGDRRQSFHKQVDLMHTLHDYSITQNAIDNKITLNCFGGDVIAFQKKGFGRTEKRDVVSNERVLYDFLEDCGYSSESISELAATTYLKSNPTGNAYFLLEFDEVLGVQKVSITVYSQQWCTKLERKGTEVNQFIITPFINDLFWQDNPPLIVNEFTSIDELETDSDGIKRAVLHYKHRGYSDRVYAVSSLGHAAIFPLFNEFQQWDMLIKETDNSFISRMLVFFENHYADNTEDPIEARKNAAAAVDAMTLRFKRASTAGSDVSTAMIPLLYPQGTQPPTVAELPSNTNEKWHESIDRKVSLAIHKLNNVDPKLTGSGTSTGLGNNGEEYRRIEENFEREKIVPTQNDIGGFLNKVFGIIAEFKNVDLQDLNVGWVTPLQKRLEEERESKKDDKNIAA